MLAQLATWPWAYYITAIACFLYGWLAQFTVPSFETNRSSRKEPFDWIGSATMISGEFITLLALLLRSTLTYRRSDSLQLRMEPCSSSRMGKCTMHRTPRHRLHPDNTLLPPREKSFPPHNPNRRNRQRRRLDPPNRNTRVVLFRNPLLLLH